MPERSTAVLAAIAVITAALLSGVVTWQVTKLTLAHDTEREQRREDVRATGAARMLITELITASDDMIILRHDRIYRPLGEGYRIDVPAEDMRLIYSRLTPNEWGAVLLALHNVAGLKTFVRADQ